MPCHQVYKSTLYTVLKRVPHCANDHIAQRTWSKIKSLKLFNHFISTNYHIGELINSNYACLLLTDVTDLWNKVHRQPFRCYFVQRSLSGVRSSAHSAHGKSLLYLVRWYRGDFFCKIIDCFSSTHIYRFKSIFIFLTHSGSNTTQSCFPFN